MGFSAVSYFIDSTHVKASANKSKFEKKDLRKKTRAYEKRLQAIEQPRRKDTVSMPRHNHEIKEIYGKRKETIERVFANAKKNHGTRWITLRGL